MQTAYFHLLHSTSFLPALCPDCIFMIEKHFIKNSRLFTCLNMTAIAIILENLKYIQ